MRQGGRETLPARHFDAGAQGIKELGRRLLDGPGAGRSNTRPSVPGGQVAQLVEQRTENPRVGGSIPPLATIESISWTRRTNIKCEISVQV